MRAHQLLLLINSKKMTYAILISIFSVISTVSVLLCIKGRKPSELSIGLFSFKFKYLGVTLVIISIVLSLFEFMENKLYNDIRIVVANLGLIIIVFSRDRDELRESSFIKVACFTLSTLFYYLANQMTVIFFGVDETTKLSQFILDLLVIYLISYHFFKYKLVKGV